MSRHLDNNYWERQLFLSMLSSSSFKMHLTLVLILSPSLPLCLSMPICAIFPNGQRRHRRYCRHCQARFNLRKYSNFNFLFYFSLFLLSFSNKLYE